MRGGIDVAIAGAVLERDSPLPAGGAGAGTGVGREAAAGRARDGHRAVAGQPVRPVLEARAERLLDEKSAKPRAVEEQLAGEALAALQPDARDPLRPLLDVDHLSFEAPHSARLGVTAQV